MNARLIKRIAGANSAGFTLIEIVMTIVLLSIISGIAAMIILQGVRSYAQESTRVDVHYQARLAMERMAREIRTATTVTATAPSSSLVFTDVTGTIITYSLSGTSLRRNADLLSSGVTSLLFSHYNNANVLTAVTASVWTIEVFVTDQQGAGAIADTLQMRTRVHPRNF